jgi:hypothetical protein
MSLRVSSILVTIALSSACSGTSSSPSGPSTPATAGITQVAGTYSGPTIDPSIQPQVQVPTWTFKFALAGQVSPRFSGCAGTLTIQQTGATLSGSYTQQDRCGGRTGQLSGVANANGTIKVSLTGADDALGWTGFAHCTAVTPGSVDLYGTVTSDMLDVSFPHDALINCPAEGTVTINVEVRGTR